MMQWETVPLVARSMKWGNLSVRKPVGSSIQLAQDQLVINVLGCLQDLLR